MSIGRRTRGKDMCFGGTSDRASGRHSFINALHIGALKTAERTAAVLGEPRRYGIAERTARFCEEFYDAAQGLFVDTAIPATSALRPTLRR